MSEPGTLDGRTAVITGGSSGTGLAKAPPEQLTAMAAQVAGDVPLGWFADHDEIARVVAFLAGPGSSCVLGAELVVDRSWTQL